jgi:hypothetical protein
MAYAAVLLAPLLTACSSPCNREALGAELPDLCPIPGVCELPAGVSFPLSDISFIQLAGGQSVVVPVASSLAGLSANPLFWATSSCWRATSCPRRPSMARSSR